MWPDDAQSVRCVEVESRGASEAEYEGQGFVEGELSRPVHGFLHLIADLLPF